MKCNVVFKQLPNALSCCRIVLSPLLLVVVDSKIAFLLLYTICGLTDVADGFIARKYNVATSIGAKLDSFADIIFSLITLYLICSQLQIRITYVMAFLLLIFVVRMINMAITKIKFKYWNVMHTVGNKATGLALFLVLPIYFLFDLVSLNLMFAVALFALLSSFEEMCILLSSSNYDVNKKSIVRFDGRKFLRRCTERVLNVKKIGTIIRRNTQ